MPSKRALVRRIRELNTSALRLRETLARYEEAIAAFAERLDHGDPVLVATQAAEVPEQRQPVTEAVQEFEAARHQLRLSLMVAARDEGASIADVGRVLGISRQLASRLAMEADRLGI